MPKCDVDFELQQEVKRFMHENRLTKSAAAKALGVDRATFWRFCSSGRAIGDTRLRYRDALAKCSGSASLQPKNVSFDAVSAADQPVSRSRPVLELSELAQIRRTCESVLALVGAYEAHMAGSKKLKTPQPAG